MTVHSDPVEGGSPRGLGSLHEHEVEVPLDSMHSESTIGLQRPSELPDYFDFLEESKEPGLSPSQMPGMVMTPPRDGLRRSFDLGVPREDLGQRVSDWKAWIHRRDTQHPTLTVLPIASHLAASEDYRTTASRIGLLAMSESEAYYSYQHLAMENAELRRRLRVAEDSQTQLFLLRESDSGTPVHHFVSPIDGVQDDSSLGEVDALLSSTSQQQALVCQPSTEDASVRPVPPTEALL